MPKIPISDLQPFRCVYSLEGLPRFAGDYSVNVALSGIGKSCGRVCQNVLKNFGTFEFTSELKTLLCSLKMADLVLQTPNTGKRQKQTHT